MNKAEVIMTIKNVGNKFSQIMACLNDPEYAAGYRQAIKDMVRLFSYAPIEPDYASERKAMLDRIKKLECKNRELEQIVLDQAGAIEKLLQNVDVCKVLGIKGVKR